MHIDRCVCTRQTFAALLKQAREQGWNLNQLIAQTGASDQCRLCRPYLCRTLRIGQTVFTELLTEADEPTCTTPDE